MSSPRLPLTLAAFMSLAGAIHAQTPTSAATDPSSQYGWLEGTVTTDQGHPVEERNMGGGKQIKLVRHGGGAYAVQSDPSMGGFFSNHQLKPGIYDVSVTTGFWGNTGSAPYRPQRILGLLIKPGQRTLLNIVMPQGETLQETGEAVVASALATNVADELTKMQKQIDDLKQQVAALQTALTATAKPQ